MRIGLDGELLRQLIESRGGVDAFLGHWSSVSPQVDNPPDRATLYRWMRGRILPKSSDTFLRLAGLLDVDPFALIAVPPGEMLAAADEILRMVQSFAGAPPWLHFVHGFFGRQKVWPPRDLASVYFARPWCLQEFTHDPALRSNYYARVLLRHSLKPPDRRPQVLHFAFKHPALFHARWLEYGLVRVNGASAVLHHISGYTDRLDLTSPDEALRVETWFGPGPALFSVASLHPFELGLAAPEDAGARALRFPG
jgi:hypothetical protein